MTKWPVQKPTLKTAQNHVEHQDVNRNKTICCGFFKFIIALMISQRNVELPPWSMTIIGGLNQFKL